MRWHHCCCYGPWCEIFLSPLDLFGRNVLWISPLAPGLWLKFGWQIFMFDSFKRKSFRFVLSLNCIYKKKLRVYIQCCIPRVAIKGWSNKYIVLQVFASKQNTCHDKFSQQEKVCLETLSVHHKACIFFSFLQPVKPNGIFCIYSFHFLLVLVLS